MKPLSETAPRLCKIQIQIQQCERRLVNSMNTLFHFYKDTLATRAHFFLPLQIHQGQGQSTARHDRLTAFYIDGKPLILLLLLYHRSFIQDDIPICFALI